MSDTIAKATIFYLCQIYEFTKSLIEYLVYPNGSSNVWSKSMWWLPEALRTTDYISVPLPRIDQHEYFFATI